MKIVEQLKALNVGFDRNSFRDFLADQFAGIYHGTWTYDELLCHPDDAKYFCNMVRSGIKAQFPESREVPDRVILGALLNTRKHN